MNTIPQIIEKLQIDYNATDAELLALITSTDARTNDLLATAADAVRKKHYGRDVYIRGLIEISNICKNNCYYCGIRAANACAERYRLDKDTILACCETGHALGFRTFVLQGGEDLYFTQERLCDIVSSIHNRYPDCAITLSVGEKSYEEYKAYFDAGATRYLLRHETANDEHYHMLHPQEMSPANRKRCLYDLKSIGYQVGSGFMVGSPHQRPEYLLEDLRFLQALQPAMIGIGPYITHRDTPFREMPSGTLALSLRMLSLLRLLFPKVLLPATTALGTIAPGGRELGLKAGGNVIMPNISPSEVRKLYQIYQNKLATGAEAGEGLKLLKENVAKAGYEIVIDKGDSKNV